MIVRKTIGMGRLGLGVVPGERSFFHENERNYQERSHRSKKKEQTYRTRS